MTETTETTERDLDAHSRLTRAIMLALGARTDLKIWVCNAGKFRSQDGRRVIQGLPNGHPDLSGFLKGGVWFGLEAKTGNARQNKDQRTWQTQAALLGARYAVVRSVADAEEVVWGWLQGLKGAA